MPKISDLHAKNELGNEITNNDLHRATTVPRSHLVALPSRGAPAKGGDVWGFF